MSNQFVIAIDGGGTKTLGALFDLKGTLIKSKLDGPSNMAVDRQGALETIRGMIEHLMENVHPKEILWIELGIAGAGRIKDKDQIIKTLQKTFDMPLDLVSDADIALAAIPRDEEQYAMLILSGTGSTIMITDGQTSHMVGGYGHLLGDEGSAYHVSIEALKDIIKHHEQGIPLTHFDQALLKHIGAADVQDIKTFVYERNKAQIAQLATFIANHAHKGDQQAKQLLEKEGEYLARQAISAYHLMKRDQEVVIDFRGGFIEKAPYVKATCMNYIEQEIKSFIINQHQKEPIEGAFQLAIDHLRRIK